MNTSQQYDVAWKKKDNALLGSISRGIESRSQDVMLVRPHLASCIRKDI